MSKTIWHILFFIVSLSVLLLIMRFIPLSLYSEKLGAFGYVGIVLSGILVTYSFTASIGVLLIIIFSHSFPVIPIALSAGIGMSLAEYIIFKTSRYTVSSITNKTSKRLRSNIPKWFFKKNNYLGLVILGILLLLLPIPDELAMSVLGLTELSTPQFLIFSYVLNIISIIILLQITASTMNLI